MSFLRQIEVRADMEVLVFDLNYQYSISEPFEINFILSDVDGK